PGFFVRLRYSVRRRTELRVVRAPVRVQSVLRDVVRVAAVAAVVLGAALLGEAACRRLVVRPPVDVDALPLPDPLVAIDGSPRPDPTEPFVDVEPPPTRVQVVSPFFAQVEEVTADDGAEAVLSWLGARNELDALRNEFRQRFSSDERRTVLAATGANPAREERIQALAAAVASKMEAELAEPSDPAARALGLRALLAAGSSRVVGPHRALVRQATESVLAELAGEPRVDLTVSLLAALTDVAVLSGGEEGEVVRRHAERIARATTDLGRGRR